MANFRDHHSLVVAKKLKAELKKLLKDKPKSWNGKGRFESYSNGREQGFALFVYQSGKTLYFAFSENRNSDSIVVYHGEDPAHPNNVPSDGHYKNAKYFTVGDYRSAAQFIIEKATQFLSFS